MRDLNIFGAALILAAAALATIGVIIDAKLVVYAGLAFVLGYAIAALYLNLISE